MNARTKNLKQLVADSLYVVDEHAIAEAIVVRSLARGVLPDVRFRCATREPQVRSFRPHRGAQSFKLTRSERRPLHHGAVAPDVFELR